MGSLFPSKISVLAKFLSCFSAYTYFYYGYNDSMLARYKIYRGKPPAGAKLPTGVRQDTRKHTRHCLRPDADSVAEYLADPSNRAWKKFSASYLKTVKQRWKEDQTPFDELAELAATEKVYLGCSCPTEKNPDVRHCHTMLALQFMRERYPSLDVEFP